MLCVVGKWNFGDRQSVLVALFVVPGEALLSSAFEYSTSTRSFKNLNYGLLALQVLSKKIRIQATSSTREWDQEECSIHN